MPLHVTYIANFLASLCCRRTAAENFSIVVISRFFLAVKRTLAITAAVFKACFRASLIAFRCARGSTASAAAVCASSTSSTSFLFFASLLC
jgi:hypothetical protein